jgi:hypothetical protein
MGRKAIHWVLVSLILTALAAQVLAAIRDKSPTADEFAHHIGSGFSYLKTGDFRMNPASPPLPRMLGGFPLILLGAKAPFDHPSWEAGDSPEFARQLFYAYNDRADEFIFWARVPFFVLSLIFALCVYGWARGTAGPAAGLAALAWYSFCPDVLAHSSIASADLPLAFFSFLALIAFWGYLKTTRASRLVLTGFFTGLAFLSKFSALFLFPVFFLLVVFTRQWNAFLPRRFAASFAVMLAVIWAGYGFEMKPLLKNTPDPAKKEAVYAKIGGEKLVEFARNTPVPLSTFSSGLASMLFTRSQGTNAFLFGEWSYAKGWWYYYFAAFLLKNTLPFLIFIGLSLFFLGRLGLEKETKLVLLVPPAFFFLATMGDRAQAGIRYFLPLYPLFFVLCAAAVAWLWKHAKAWKAFALALLFWHAGEALAISPHYLAYFNEAGGGPGNGYRLLRDSNLDWGQDLKGLSKYLREHGYGKVALHYHWPASPDYYGIDYRTVEEDEMSTPRRDVYAISVHVLSSYKWTEKVEPVAKIGYSTFVYDLRKGTP